MRARSKKRRERGKTNMFKNDQTCRARRHKNNFSCEKIQHKLQALLQPERPNKGWSDTKKKHKTYEGQPEWPKTETTELHIKTEKSEIREAKGQTNTSRNKRKTKQKKEK